MATPRKSRKNATTDCATLVKKSVVQPAPIAQKLFEAPKVKRSITVRKHPINKKIFISEVVECGDWMKLRYSKIEYITPTEAQEALNRNDVEFGPWQAF